MIPIYDENPTKRFPYLTIVLLVANIAIFGYEITLSSDALQTLFGTWGFTPVHYFASPLAPTALMTIVTAMFLHGGWLHLIGNMLYLWIFGNNIEDRLGPIWFLLLYLGGGVGATMAHALIYPTSDVPLVGASGAIAALLGAYLVLYPKAKVVTVIPVFVFIELAKVPAAFVIGMWFLLQLAQGVGSIGAATGVAWWAHVGGFVIGAAAMLPLIFGARIKSMARRRTRGRAETER